MRSLLYRTSWYSTPAQSRPSFTWSNASGRRGFSSEPIVSSKTRSRRPWYLLVYASFRTNARAFPMWSGPLGYGASRRTTLPSTAPGSGGSSFGPTSARALSRSSGAIDVSSARWASGERRFTSATTRSTSRAASFARLRNDGSSESNRPRTALASALPSWRTAFCNANFRAEFTATCVRSGGAVKESSTEGPYRNPGVGRRVPAAETVPARRLSGIRLRNVYGPRDARLPRGSMVGSPLPTGTRGGRVRGVGVRLLRPLRRGRDPGRASRCAYRGRPPSDRRADRALRRVRERVARRRPWADRLVPTRLRRRRGHDGAETRVGGPRRWGRRPEAGDRHRARRPGQRRHGVRDDRRAAEAHADRTRAGPHAERRVDGSREPARRPGGQRRDHDREPRRRDGGFRDDRRLRRAAGRHDGRDRPDRAAPAPCRRLVGHGLLAVVPRRRCRGPRDPDRRRQRDADGIEHKRQRAGNPDDRTRIDRIASERRRDPARQRGGHRRLARSRHRRTRRGRHPAHASAQAETARTATRRVAAADLAPLVGPARNRFRRGPRNA